MISKKKQLKILEVKVYSLNYKNLINEVKYMFNT